MSARDYDRFLHMLQDGGALDGVRVMKPETVALAMSNLLPAGRRHFGVLGNDWRHDAGREAGLRRRRIGLSRGRAGRRRRKGTYGWGGAAGTIAWVDPAKHVRGTVMVNYFPGDNGRCATRWSALAPISRDR